jgi:hypothetical protein
MCFYRFRGGLIPFLRELLPAIGRSDLLQIADWALAFS